MAMRVDCQRYRIHSRNRLRQVHNVEYSDRHRVPESQSGHGYILEVDGVDLPIKLSEKMILSVHRDSPGVLLILLSALATAGINIKGLQLGKRGNKGYAVMSIEGDSFNGEEIKRKLGPLYYEVSYLNQSQLNNSRME
jgi:histidinol-phosphatase (PHP family)